MGRPLSEKAKSGNLPSKTIITLPGPGKLLTHT